MSKAIEMLMNEHRVIEAVLGSLETYVRKVEKGEPVDRKTVGEFVQFFRNFADKCHHGKEEDLLFPRMERYGFSPLAGPLSVMLHEHDMGRSQVAGLAAVADASGPVTEEETASFRSHAAGYIALLSAHIAKEDGVLFRMAVASLPATELEQLYEDFEHFEANVMGAGIHQEFHDLADRLVARFQPSGQPAARVCCGH